MPSLFNRLIILINDENHFLKCNCHRKLHRLEKNIYSLSKYILMNTITRILLIFILFFQTFITQAQTYCPSSANLPYEQWNQSVSVSDGYANSYFLTPVKQGYGDYTNLTPAILLKGKSNLITISPTGSWSGDPRNANMFWRVWIDFNGDGIFTLSEQVISRQVVIKDGVFLDNEMAFTPPSNAKPGKTRMRISMKVGGYPEPCETFERGEVQDFTVDIRDGTVSSGRDTLRLVNVTGDTSVRQGGQVHLNITIKNTGTQASSPNTPVSIYQEQFDFPTRGAPITEERIASNRVSIGRSIQPGETVTVPVALTVSDSFTNISPDVFPFIPYGKTTVVLGNRSDFFSVSLVFPDVILDTLLFFYKINAILDKTDLSAEIFAADTTYAVGGSTVNYTVKITNRGTVKAKNVSTKIFTSPNRGDLIITPQRGFVSNEVFYFGTYIHQDWYAGDLAPGESLTAQVKIVIDSVYANQNTSFTAIADVFSNQIEDTNTSNNHAEKIFSRASTINPGNYCASKSNAPWEVWISKIEFNTINNESGKFKDISTAGYSDYTNLSTTVQRGTTYLLNITPASSWSGNLPNVYTKVWIDYNGDNIFDDSEAVIQYVGAAPFLPQIRIPNASATGTVRMRVAVKLGSFPSSCETFEKGEVEDYSLSFFTGGNNDSSDIAVSIATVPNFFTPYKVLNFTITADNISTQPFTNVNIEFKFPDNTASGGTAVTTRGTWNEYCAGGVQCFTWTIPNIPAKTTAVLVVPVFVLNPTSPIVATAKLLSSTPTDTNAANNTATISINAGASVAPLEQFLTTQFIPIVIEKISPNPTDGDLEIVLQSLDEREFILSFSDTYGRLIKSNSTQLEKGINKLHYDVSDLPQGIYFISHPTSNGVNMPIKFVKM